MAVYTDILNQVQTDVQGLALDNIDNENVVVLKRPTDDPKAMPAYPGIQVAPFGSQNVRPGTNVRDDMVYPVIVAALHKNEKSQSKFLDRQMTWLESIRKKFINQRLSGVTSVHTCFVDPRDSFEPTAWDKSIDFGYMILRFVSRETRG